MKKLIGILLFLIIFTFALDAKEYFVRLSGNDDNPGSYKLPFRTIFKASEIAMPGDTITIWGGNYKLEKQFRPIRSGEPEKWIVYRSAPNESVVFDDDQIKKVFRNGDSVSFSSLTEGGQIEKVNYLRFENIEVHNSNAAGFIVRGPKCKKIELIGCKSHHSHNSGIGLWYCDSVLVSGCEITGANDNSDRYFASGQKRKEAPHEALSICGARYFEVANNYIHDCFKEGIDCKEVSKHRIMRWGLHFLLSEVKRALKERNFIAEENLFECSKNCPSRVGQFGVQVYEYLPPTIK